MICEQCGAPMTGRKRKYCDKTCSIRAWSAMRRSSPELCERDGCTQLRGTAKGLCKTHYNQTLPNRHKPRTATCVACGAHIARSSGGGGRKYGATCSLECRRRITWGETSQLPAGHWGRWYGANCPIAFIESTCDWCGRRYATRHTTSTVCSDRCREARRWQRRYARQHEAEGEYRWAQVAILWAKLGRRCTYCRDDLPLAEMQVEHVTPLSRGGRNDMTNIVPSCAPCNGEKSDRTPEEWDADRQSHGLPTRLTTITRSPHLTQLVRLEPTGIPYRLRSIA